MVEYGGGIQNGPAGQVGGGNAPDFGGSGPDVFASVGNVFNDAASFVASQPPEILALAIVLFFVGLIVLKRAF